MRGTWDDLNRRLTGAILALDLGDSLIIGEFPEVPKRRFRKAAEPEPTRFVQITAGQSVLIAECVGSTSFGGTLEMPTETEEALVGLGWDRPWSEELRTFSRESALVGAPRLAMATVRALQTLGCEMADLDVRLVRDEETAGG